MSGKLLSQKSARCRVCLYRFRTRANGTLQAHWIYDGSRTGGHYCKGAGMLPKRTFSIGGTKDTKSAGQP